MSPEAVSPVFSDRLIHPLPKRRLRDRLSTDAADSIKYPPDQTPGAPLFYYPYSLKQDGAHVERPIFTGQASPAAFASNPSAATTTSATLATRQGLATNRTSQLLARARRSSSETESPSATRTTRAVNRPARPTQSLHIPPAQGYWSSPPTALAADGFDSFEYTSNTKKRKIPSAGDTSHTGSYTSTSLRSTASESSDSSFESLAYSPPSPVDVKPSGFAAAAALGISGPGRGRYGRTQRYPAAASARNIFLTPASKNVLDSHRKQQLPRPGQFASQDPVNNSGIISNAIANAERRGSHGQESVGLVDQGQESDAYPQGSLQFTFTCSSKVPGNLLWAGSESRSSPGSAYWQHGQQQVRSRGGQGTSHTSVSGTSNGSSAGGKSSKGAGSGRSKQQLEKEKEAVKLRLELRKQARDRRRSQQELNAARPTPEGDIYICPFCEYENITGHKPRLIYEFEMKERKKRLEMERRQREQRNKEKARNRNRKGRRATKAPAATAGSHTQPESLDDEQLYDNTQDDSGQGTIDDDEYEDDDGAGEADDYVAELRLGVGDNNKLRLRGRDGEVLQQPPLAGS